SRREVLIPPGDTWYRYDAPSWCRTKYFADRERIRQIAIYFASPRTLKGVCMRMGCRSPLGSSLIFRLRQQRMHQRGESNSIDCEQKPKFLSQNGQPKNDDHNNRSDQQFAPDHCAHLAATSCHSTRRSIIFFLKDCQLNEPHRPTPLNPQARTAKSQQ